MKTSKLIAPAILAGLAAVASWQQYRRRHPAPDPGVIEARTILLKSKDGRRGVVIGADEDGHGPAIWLWRRDEGRPYATAHVRLSEDGLIVEPGEMAPAPKSAD